MPACTQSCSRRLNSLHLALAVLLLAATQPASVSSAPTLAPRLDARADFASRAFFDDVLQGICPEQPRMPGPFTPPPGSRSVIKRFIHVPKTGGTSLNSVLEAAAHMEGKLMCFLLASQANNQGRFFDPDQPLCDVISSEFDGSHRFQVPEAVSGRIMDFTLLRDPIHRAFSQYQHHLVGGRYNKDEFRGKFGDDRAKENEERLIAFLSDKLCGLTDTGLAYCESLKDPTKCSGKGWCGIFRNHQANVITGARLFTDDFVDMLFKDDQTVLCAAQTQLNDFGVVGITEYFGASVCLLLHEFKWTKTFKQCCQGQRNPLAPGQSFHLTCPELAKVSQENVRTSSSHRARNEEHEMSEDYESSNYMNAYLSNPRIMAIAERANAVDCHLYNFGLHKFKMRVRVMETETNMHFLPSDIKDIHCSPLPVS